MLNFAFFISRRRQKLVAGDGAGEGVGLNGRAKTDTIG
jgi:hypothetical protein